MQKSKTMRFLILLLSLAAATLLPAQPDTLFLQNPSFEDLPRHSKAPIGWSDCGPEGESPPDVHPTGDFGVTQPAFHGATYLGLVVRDNGTWERIGQRLVRPLAAGQCYQLSGVLGQSPVYTSLSRKTGQQVNYAGPVLLRVWGGTANCRDQALLAVTRLDDPSHWERHTLTFRAPTQLSHLLLEAYYVPEEFHPYNSHLLVDDLSPLVPIDCDQVGGPVRENTGEAVTGRRPSVLEAIRRPRTVEELDALVREYGPKLAFHPHHAQVDRATFRNARDELVTRSLPLAMLAKAMRSFPGQTLIIAVNGRGHPRSAGELMDAVTYELGMLNAPVNIFVEKYRTKDAGKDWLWGEKENAAVRMRWKE